MPRTDRAAALNVAWTALWWLLDPDHDRWGKVREVLNDPTSRLTIDQGSRDETGRRSSGTHSDPTGAAALAVLDVGLDLRRQQRALRRDEADIAEAAHWIRATIAGEDHEAPATLPEAVWSIWWSNTDPHTAAGWRYVSDDEDEVKEKHAEFDHACDHLAFEAQALAAKVRLLLAGAVNEKPTVEQPKRRDCRAHAEWAKWLRKNLPDRQVPNPLPAASVNGLCDRCDSYRKREKHPPSAAIVEQWEHLLVERLSPSLIAEARAAYANRRKKRAG